LTAGYTFTDRFDEKNEAPAFTYQKKLLCAILDKMQSVPKAKTSIIFTEHRGIGKSALLDFLRDEGYAVHLSGVDRKLDKAAIAKMLEPDPDGPTIFRSGP